MVGTGDVKFYKSTASLGGAITATQIIHATFDNLFPTVTQPEAAAGADHYACMYLKNTHASEAMEGLTFWLGTDTQPTDTTVKWGFDPETTAPGTYHYSPAFTSNGSNTDETTATADHNLLTFTIAAWFRSATAPTPDEGWIVNKGGTGSDTAGQNLNWGLWMTNTGAIRGGFETGAGVDNFVVSPLATYDNGVWHFAVLTYDNITLSLYVNDMTTPVATLATTSTPETNALPIRINQNSRASNGWFPSGAQIDEVRVWNRAMTDVDERTALYMNNTVNETGLVFEKDFGDLDFSLVAQTIANITTAPVGVTWHEANVEPSTVNIGRLPAGVAIPIWVWWHTDAGAIARKDDRAIFNGYFLVPGQGTGDPGTGTPGQLTTDQFGIRMIYPTATAGRTYYSNWHLSATTTHQWDGTSGQDFGNLDPQDPMADLVCPATNRAIVDAAQDVLIATTNSNKNSWRYYIKDSLDDETASTWKWSESVEITVYYKAISDYSGGSIHVHCRIMGPTEHWLALNTCGGAGHEYSYEIKKNLVNQFRKEEFHVEPDSGYCANIEFPDNSAPYDKWIGMKLTTQLQDGNMKIQAWKDLTDGVGGGTWIKAGEMVDDGTNWTLESQDDVDVYTALAAGVANCTKIPTLDQALTMDASAIGLRVDNTLVHFKKFSVREIDPDNEGSGGSGGSSGGGGTGGGTGGNPPPTPTAYKIAISGDWGCEGATDDVIALLRNKGYATDTGAGDTYLIGVGDNAYASSSCWLNRFQDFLPFFTSAYGNHEYSESGGIGPYKNFFSHNLTYFTKKFQNVLIVVFDTNINCDPGSTQHNFIKSALETSQSDPTIKWRIAIGHHPWFGASSDHGNNEFDQVQAFHQLFTTNKVSFVFTGHNHNWQRSHKVAYNAANPESPTVVDSTSPFTNDTTGLFHIVSGTGGHDSGGGLYSLGSQPAFQGFQNRTHNGIYEILASDNGLTWTCSFVEIGGDKFDEIVITTT